MRLLIAKLTGASVHSLSIALNADSDVADIATDLENCAELLAAGGYDLVLIITGHGRVRAREALARLRHEAGGVPMVVLTEPAAREPAGTASDAGALAPMPGADGQDPADQHWPWRGPLLTPVARAQGDIARPPRRPPIRLEPDGETLRAGDRTVGLSHAESRIFAALWDQRGEIVSAEELLTAIYGEGDRPASRVLPVFLFKLRRKLAALGFEELIETAVGRGFLIRADSHARPPMASSDL